MHDFRSSILEPEQSAGSNEPSAITGQPGFLETILTQGLVMLIFSNASLPWRTDALRADEPPPSQPCRHPFGRACGHISQKPGAAAKAKANL
jgi:hypothetical protein